MIEMFKESYQMTTQGAGGGTSPSGKLAKSAQATGGQGAGAQKAAGSVHSQAADTAVA